MLNCNPADNTGSALFHSTTWVRLMIPGSGGKIPASSKRSLSITITEPTTTKCARNLTTVHCGPKKHSPRECLLSVLTSNHFDEPEQTGPCSLAGARVYDFVDMTGIPCVAWVTNDGIRGADHTVPALPASRWTYPKISSHNRMLLTEGQAAWGTETQQHTGFARSLTLRRPNSSEKGKEGIGTAPTYSG